MAQNKTILLKIKKYTKDDIKQQQFLGEIFKFECSPKNGWYEKHYKQLLETHCEVNEE